MRVVVVVVVMVRGHLPRMVMVMMVATEPVFSACRGHLVVGAQHGCPGGGEPTAWMIHYLLLF